MTSNCSSYSIITVTTLSSLFIYSIWSDLFTVVPNFAISILAILLNDHRKRHQVLFSPKTGPRIIQQKVLLIQI